MATEDDHRRPVHDPTMGELRSCPCVTEENQYRLRLALEDALARRGLALAAEDRAAARAHTIAAQKLRWRLADAVSRAATYVHHSGCVHQAAPADIAADM
jgi:hypothetical protein